MSGLEDHWALEAPHMKFSYGRAGGPLGTEGPPYGIFMSGLENPRVLEAPHMKFSYERAGGPLGTGGPSYEIFIWADWKTPRSHTGTAVP